MALRRTALDPSATLLSSFRYGLCLAAGRKWSATRKTVFAGPVLALLTGPEIVAFSPFR
jgi:hypothetical protein